MPSQSGPRVYAPGFVWLWLVLVGLYGLCAQSSFGKYFAQMYMSNGGGLYEKRLVRRICLPPLRSKLILLVVAVWGA